MWLIFRQPHPNFINVRTAYASEIWAQLTKNSSHKIKHRKIPKVHRCSKKGGKIWEWSRGQIGKTEGMAEVNKNQDPGADSLSAARPYRPLSLRARLILLLFVIAIPLTGMALGFQKMIASYSASYDAILANLKTANEYNIKFKSDMEYSMYRVMIGLIDAEQFENGDIVEARRSMRRWSRIPTA